MSDIEDNKREQPSVLAAVLTFNRKELLLEVLRSLMGQDGGAPDILIVDNNSTDGTYEAISGYLAQDNVHYENPGSNLGGAGGFNHLIKTACRMGYDRLWIMDDDCVPGKGALAALLDADRKLNGTFGWLSSLSYWTDGSICMMNRQCYQLGRKVEDHSSPMVPAILASFVSLYVPTSVIYDVGLNIKEFVMQTDDWELTRRISRKYPCYVVNGSKVTHKSANNFGGNIALDSVDRIWMYKFAYRNEVYVMFREGLHGVLYWILKLCYHGAKILFCAKDNKMKRLKTMLSGAWSGLFFHPQIEYVDTF